jgi:hypothetical protein
MAPGHRRRDETNAELEEGGRSAQEQGPPRVTDITETDERTVHRSAGTATDDSGDSHCDFLRAAVDGDGREATGHAQYYSSSALRLPCN